MSDEFLRLRVDELVLPPEARRAVLALRARTVRELVARTPAEVLHAAGGSREVLGVIQAELAQLGLELRAGGDPLPPPPSDRRPEWTWGCLHVHDPPGGLAAVREALVAVHAAARRARVAWQTPADLAGRLPPPGAATVNRSSRLDDDEQLVQAIGAPGWVAVMSRAWELAPPAKNVLAARLSEALDHPVLAVTSVQGAWAEASLYERGAAVALALRGPAPPRRPDVPELDFTWFADKGAVVPAPELSAALDDPEHFRTLAGCEGRGLRDAFEGAPLDDFEPDDYLVFRSAP